MTEKQVNCWLQTWQGVILVPAMLLVLALAAGFVEGRPPVVMQLPTATFAPTGTALPTATLTKTLTATPTAIVATLQTPLTPQAPITQTEVTTSLLTTLPDAFPIPPQLNCDRHLLPCGCPTPELRYVFPVQPPEVADYAAAHHDYPATDIFAPYRSVFVAVTNGVIDELSYEDTWNPAVDDPALRSGRYVTIIGDDGVRYHGSHLDEVVPGLAAGDRVVAGQILGYVGNSGNARGIAYHLHFGISPPTVAGDWETRRGVLSPYPYLQAWAQHEMLMPDLSLMLPK